MPRGSGHAADRTQQAKPRESRREISKAPLPAEHLSPVKRRIAEALAALLVAHYRRQQRRPDPERDGIPSS